MKRTIAIAFLLSFSIPAIATPYWYGIAGIYLSDRLEGLLGIGLQLNERFGIEGQWETAYRDLDDLDLPGDGDLRSLREQFELTTDQGLSVDVKTDDYLSVLGTVTIPLDNTFNLIGLNLIGFKLIGKAGLSYHWLKYDISPYTYQTERFPGGDFKITPVFDDPVYERDEKGFTPMVSLGLHVTTRSWFQKTNFELGLAHRLTDEISDANLFVTLRHRF
ncbi:MAG: hypothetical protein OXH84_03095 [Gammaproteobacteria bacterium]|nr:hypothetical protein [Gammaproteobacteria bacterium]